jgi:nitroreductase
MMEVSAAIEQRRAIKWYDPSHRMSEAESERLLSLAMLSPTAFNIQNWRFVVVKDNELRQKIRAAAWDQAQVTEASLLVVLAADLKAWDKEPAHYWRNAPPEVQDYLVSAIAQYYTGREQVQRDEAMRSCGIAAMNLMLAAKEMGYESCPMDGFDFDAVSKIINLPEDHIITMMVAIGKGIRKPSPRSGQLAMDQIVIKDHF